MTAHRSLAALTAAAVTAAVLLARWWVSSRPSANSAPRHETGPAEDDRISELHPALLDSASNHALREAEELLSRQWNRLWSLYPRHPDDTTPH
ncbi:hypothetical protein QF032_007888 [Streptomyces achromogenes]|uniref:hypothetical protein n=1 Tax=Streptomyces achromogenes TaxID=67255 RepID=UPI0027872481|nr:hypothetical protein [Streptomyces achromogenes]MDQ0836044.1 hypothetical protein [Streptomyces achromogenes]